MKNLNKNKTLLFSFLLSILVIFYLLGLLSSWIFPLLPIINKPFFHNITYSMFITFWALSILANILLYFINCLFDNSIKRKVKFYILSINLVFIMSIIVSFIYFKTKIFPIYANYYKDLGNFYMSMFPSEAYFLVITFIYAIFIWIITDMLNQHLLIKKFLKNMNLTNLKASKENSIFTTNEIVFSSEKFEKSNLLIDCKSNQLYFNGLEKILTNEPRDKFSHNISIKKVNKEELNFDIYYKNKIQILTIKCELNNKNKNLIVIYNNNGKWNNEVIELEAK